MKTLKGRASPTFAVKAALAVITALATLGSVPAFAQAVIIAPSPPPPMRTEVVPVARPGYVWDGGHWRWAGGGYKWVPGHWRPVRVGAHWVPGHWVQRGPNWRWIEGHWAR
jgi:WXXGXW repeat (2 copies)